MLETSKGIPPTENLSEISISEEARLSSEIDRLSHSEDVTIPIKVPVHFFEGTGYAGTLPISTEQSLWPGPRGGAFIWLSSSSEEQAGSYVRAGQKVKLHRLELQVGGDDVALYSCKEVDLQRANPTIGFFKKLFTNPRSALIHPLNTLSNLETQKRSDLALLADFPFGPLGGRDPHPVIWNNLKGNATEFDPKSLKTRGAQDLLKGGSAVSREPIYDEGSGYHLMIQRTDGVGSDSRYSQFRLLALIPGTPRLATFMAPRSLSLNLLALHGVWAVCSAVFYDRRLFYLLHRHEGRLMAVYQSCVSGIKKFIRLKSIFNGETLELIVLMNDGALRKYLFPRVSVEMARFDGAAGLLTSFPSAEFETVSDGPFDQVQATKGGFFCRNGSIIVRLNEKFVSEQILSLSPQRLADFSLFPLTKDGQVCIGIIGSDPYSGRVTMNIIDGGDMQQIMKILLGTQHHQMTLVPSIYIPTRSI